MTNLVNIQEQTKVVLKELEEQISFKQGSLFVIGCSTSEVAGKRIGTGGTTEIAETLFVELKEFQARTGIRLAFQCCEHLNRALIVEEKTALDFGLEIVSVIPIRSAGGAMATYAYGHMENPVVVEFIQADAGIDIGDTLIGMHLKRVAVPVRINQKTIGVAHISCATTRPKLIGGERAVYR